MTLKPVPKNAVDPRRVRIGGYAPSSAVRAPVRHTGIVRIGGYQPSN